MIAKKVAKSPIFNEFLAVIENNCQAAIEAAWQCEIHPSHQ
jgi:hypothetical protein